ncbi:MAG: hypothetical protein RL213_1141 [Bacteroidota bacterium]|jgi:hypothetical protein
MIDFTFSPKIRIIFRAVLVGVLVFCSSALHAQQLKAGVRIQKTYGMYWENGISAQYGFRNFKPDRLLIGLDVVSSRFGTAIGSNAIKQESYLLSGSWLFNKRKPYHITTRLNLGYFYSDPEESFFEVIPHTSFLFSPEVGFIYDFKKIPLSLNLGSGVYIITAEDGYSPGTLQPLYFHFDIHYRIYNKTTR